MLSHTPLQTSRSGHYGPWLCHDSDPPLLRGVPPPPPFVIATPLSKLQ